MAGKPSATPTAADFDEADDLFGDSGTSTTDADFNDADDLLNSVQEDDAEGWVPQERGEAISGVVTKVGETRSDFATSDEDAMCPTVTVQTKDGDKYRVIGYGAVLRRELQDANPKVGDLLAVKYWGEKPIKKGKFQGKMYKHFSVAVKHR
jgi:hypothetical protein